MRLTKAASCVQLGCAEIESMTDVLELDTDSQRLSYHATQRTSQDQNPSNVAVTRQELDIITSQMAIVVPCMNERLESLGGVLSGIPHDNLIIVVSNSRLEGLKNLEKSEPTSTFITEKELLTSFSQATGRSSIIIHQRDPGAATAVQAAGFAALLDSTGLVRNGKGEGMLLGVLLAALAGRKYVGFVDADNFVPGAVLEYCRLFAVGLHLARENKAGGMVRLKWRSKPKCENNEIVFRESGRSSAVVNEWLNRLVRAHTNSSDISASGREQTDIIATGNAGEHAMTVNLALRMRFASGYAVEPFQLLDLFEELPGIGPRVSGKTDQSPPQKQPVRIVQIRTQNPHFHAEKGNNHVKKMWTDALGTIYHCTKTPAALRQELLDFMIQQGVVGENQEPGRPRVYPPARNMDFGTLRRRLTTEARSLQTANVTL